MSNTTDSYYLAKNTSLRLAEEYFSKGETGVVYNFSPYCELIRFKDSDDIKKQIVNEINAYFDATDNAVTAKDVCVNVIEDNIICAQYTATGSGAPAPSAMLELFKKGEIPLFTAELYFTVEKIISDVNDELVKMFKC